MGLPHLLDAATDDPRDPGPAVSQQLHLGAVAHGEGGEIRQHLVDLAHRCAGAFHHAHGDQFLELFKAVEVRHGHQPRPRLRGLEVHLHPHRGHLGIGRTILVREAVEHLETDAFFHREELPVAGGTLPIGSRHRIVRLSAHGHVVTGEGGRPAWRAPETFDLARVGIGIPEPAHRHGKVGHDRESQGFRILGHGSDGHGEVLSGFLGEQLVEAVDAALP